MGIPSLDDRIADLVEMITALDGADKVEALNRARLSLHAVSPFRAHPVDLVLWVPADQVEANDYNLNISRYVDTTVAEERIDIGAALARLRELEAERDRAAKRMDELLAELGYGR